MKEQISNNLKELHGRIADACEEYDRDTDDITIVAISKTHPVAAIQRVVAAGIHNIGESRIQQAEALDEAGLYLYSSPNRSLPHGGTPSDQQSQSGSEFI